MGFAIKQQMQFLEKWKKNNSNVAPASR